MRVGVENDVKIYGTQTRFGLVVGHVVFENDVKMYGTQTAWFCPLPLIVFENDVKFIFVNNKNR